MIRTHHERSLILTNRLLYILQKILSSDYRTSVKKFVEFLYLKEMLLSVQLRFYKKNSVALGTIDMVQNRHKIKTVDFRYLEYISITKNIF